MSKLNVLHPRDEDALKSYGPANGVFSIRADFKTATAATLNLCCSHVWGIHITHLVQHTMCGRTAGGFDSVQLLRPKRHLQ